MVAAAQAGDCTWTFGRREALPLNPSHRTTPPPGSRFLRFCPFRPALSKPCCRRKRSFFRVRITGPFQSWCARCLPFIVVRVNLYTLCAVNRGRFNIFRGGLIPCRNCPNRFRGEPGVIISVLYLCANSFSMKTTPGRRFTIYLNPSLRSLPRLVVCHQNPIGWNSRARASVLLI